MKELDLLLVRYLRECWPAATAAQRQLFEDFLELPDPQILAYLVAGETTSDPALQALIADLQAGRTRP